VSRAGEAAMRTRSERTQRDGTLSGPAGIARRPGIYPWGGRWGGMGVVVWRRSTVVVDDDSPCYSLVVVESERGGGRRRWFGGYRRDWTLPACTESPASVARGLQLL